LRTHLLNRDQNIDLIAPAQGRSFLVPSDEEEEFENEEDDDATQLMEPASPVLARRLY
jgi:hypothetical protein